MDSVEVLLELRCLESAFVSKTYIVHRPTHVCCSTSVAWCALSTAVSRCVCYVRHRCL